MRQIVSRLDALPDKGAVELQVVKSGIFYKKEEEMYICPNGHINHKGAKFCSDTSCQLDIKGLTPEQHEIINKFKILTSILGNMLK